MRVIRPFHRLSFIWDGPLPLHLRDPAQDAQRPGCHWLVSWETGATPEGSRPRGSVLRETDPQTMLWEAVLPMRPSGCPSSSQRSTPTWTTTGSPPHPPDPAHQGSPRRLPADTGYADQHRLRGLVAPAAAVAAHLHPVTHALASPVISDQPSTVGNCTPRPAPRRTRRTPTRFAAVPTARSVLVVCQPHGCHRRSPLPDAGTRRVRRRGPGGCAVVVGCGRRAAAMAAVPGPAI